jgi:type I restriction enzyme, R subunit
MTPGSGLQTNFAQLEEHDQLLVSLGMLSEKYFTEDPNTCILKLRQLGEALAQHVASRVGLLTSTEESQFDLIRRLQDEGILPREVAQLFDEIRRAGNAASHAVAGDYGTALTSLKIAWQVGVWYHRTFKNPQFKSGPFVPPTAPKEESAALRAELERLNHALDEYRATHLETEKRLLDTEQKLKVAKDEQSFWEEMAVETENAKAELASRLVEQQENTPAQPKSAVSAFLSAASAAADSLELDESETRRLIDEQLKLAGWQADSMHLTFASGAHPEKGKYLAIAEWPTATGPADYILFAGLVPLATVEAKRKNIDVSGSLQQAKRYSRSFHASDSVELFGGPWGEFQIPFVFSSNGRPYLRQLSTRSGIWFCDVRRPDNLAHALDGWYTPEGLLASLKRDEDKSREQLAAEPLQYDFQLRPYQQTAIRAIEKGINEARREMLVAMATGTGKTKTCIALIYRLLKAQRFKRILFLVDRSALGEQAANAFKDTRMENLQTFADIFGIKELEEQKPDSETAVHIATIQGMVKRVLYPGEDATVPPIDQYDCIVVDECHRGYLLDRELSDAELTFRSYDEYISKYRRVLDYFDAVKIGLTATPALHTSQIFGMPIFSYSYREAVIDGYLVDHEPPIQIRTALSEGGINWRVGEQVPFIMFGVTRSISLPRRTRSTWKSKISIER